MIMSLRKLLNKILEKLFHVKIYSIRAHGREDWFDIRKSGKTISTVFDVGANIGQSAGKFRKSFPQAEICCFEPVKHIFEKLRENTKNDARINCYPYAMGSKQGTSEIFLTLHDTVNSLIKPENFRGKEIVDVVTVDNFVQENNISTIDLLKIDVEGFDLEVLKGANNMLSSGNISFVLIEVCFHPEDNRHAYFDTVRDFLLERGYSLYGIYEQQLEHSGENRLRYANVCFCRGV